MTVLLNLLVGFGTGVLSGCGVGGGSLLILYLTTFVGVDQSTAGALNLLYFLRCAPAALVSHVRQRRVSFSAVGWCSLAGIVTSALGALLATLLPASWLRRAFGMLLLYVGAKEVCCKKETLQG